MISVAKLNGSFQLCEKPDFDWSLWYEGEFQAGFEKWIEQNIGFRPLFVNIYNQYRFSFFNQVSAVNTFVGKNNVLYQTSYLNSYMGKNFIGSQEIKESVRKMKCVQDELHENGKLFLYIIAPGKVSFFPEYLPDSIDIKEKDSSNYDVFSKELLLKNINHIDFRKFFIEAKDTSQYPLYPKTGTHWSGYGITLVSDSILKYVESFSDIDFVDYTIKNGIVTNENLRHTDEDIEKGINLAFNITDWDMFYPELEFGDTLGKDLPTLLDIGDSYNQSFWGFYPFFQTVFSNDSRFWYYYKTESWPGVDDISPSPMIHRNLREEIDKCDVIMIVATEANLYLKGYGFIEDAYLRLTDEGRDIQEELEKEIKSYLRRIRNSPDWLKSIKDRAKARDIGVDEMMRLEAKWMIHKKSKK
ncbi:MAG: hypothetical protein U9R19_01550 [Bacteroidota bacterium]|nr:hypothetical protein [Bacteroidota bacterium]